MSDVTPRSSSLSAPSLFLIPFLLGVLTVALLFGLLPRPAVAQTAYTQQVQQMYVAYYGRPGDPGGVEYWAGRLNTAGGAWIADLVTEFGTSAEYTDRFDGLSDEALIDNLYRQLFNRAAEPVGSSFYVDLLGGTNLSGLNPSLRQSTLAQIALDIANGARNEDLRALENKIEVAEYFTGLIEQTGRRYGSADIDDAVEILEDVTSDGASVARGKAAVDAFIGIAEPQEIRVEVFIFGQGAVRSADGAISVDSTSPQDDNTAKGFFPRNPTDEIILSATPKPETEILGWSGCDLVSEDLTQCRVYADKDHQIVASFGFIETLTRAPIYDLTGADLTVSDGNVEVTVPASMTDLISALSSAAVGHFITGPSDGGFLRRILALQRIAATRYSFTTEDAALPDVIERGTLSVSRTLTNGDLLDYGPRSDQTAPMPLAVGRSVSGSVYLIPSEDPSDPVFRLRFGSAAQDENTLALGAIRSGGEVCFTNNPDDDGEYGEACLSGEVEMEFDIDWGLGLIGPERSFKYIETKRSSQSLTVTSSGGFRLERSRKIGTIRFAPIIIFCGPVPIYLEPSVEVRLGVEGSIAASFEAGIALEQTMLAGVIWNNAHGWASVGEFRPSWTPTYPEMNVEAEIKGFIEAGPEIKIYGLTGPALPFKPYLQTSASPQVLTSNPTCTDGLKVVFSAGAEAAFKWDLSSDSELAEKLGLEDILEGAEDYLTFKIKILEKDLKTWTIGGSCPDNPHLEVEGDSLYAEIQAFDNAPLIAEYRLTNDGGAPLSWSAEVKDDTTDGAVTVSPWAGLLGIGQRETVTATVDTSLLGVGAHRATLAFLNADRTPADPMGSTEKFVRIEVFADHHWDVGAWGGCSGPCGDGNGTRERSVVCRDFSGNRVPDNLCPAPKPATSESCTASQCPVYDWDVGAWGVCSGPCGDGNGTRERSIVCRDFSGNPVPDNLCPAPKPATSESCTASQCPSLSFPLNDTGIDWCADEDTNFLACPVAGYPWQDAQDGRDVTHNDDSDGSAGFSFTKLDGSGNPLPASATSWSCVRDNVTGLVWEVKTDDGGLRDKDWTYSWYNPDDGTNGGDAGTQDDGWCGGGIDCDTHAFVAAVNAQGLCGADDWRLASVDELLSIVSNDRYGPAIDSAWFPNTRSSPFWSSSPNANYSGYAWYVDFNYGHVSNHNKHGALPVRLVRAGQ